MLREGGYLYITRVIVVQKCWRGYKGRVKAAFVYYQKLCHASNRIKVVYLFYRVSVLNLCRNVVIYCFL